jgi:AcrR family transcriptional regulator
MPKSTKQVILDSALQLFNERNVDQVTIRDVAGKAGISHGNLCYHYPNIESLVENLYKQLVSELDEQTEKMSGQEISFAVLRASSVNVFQILYRYKFLMLDFVTVMRKSKFIRDHYRKLYRTRKEQFRKVLAWMTGEKYLKPELYPGHYEKVIEQLFIIGDFWIASAEILFEGKERDKVAYYADIVDQVLMPYFTDKALRQLSTGG